MSAPPVEAVAPTDADLQRLAYKHGENPRRLTGRYRTQFTAWLLAREAATPANGLLSSRRFEPDPFGPVDDESSLAPLAPVIDLPVEPFEPVVPAANVGKPRKTPRTKTSTQPDATVDPWTRAKTPWADLHVQVHIDAVTGLGSEWAMRVIRLRRIKDNLRHDIYASPAFLSEILGAKRRSIRDWLMPAVLKHADGSAYYQGGPLSEDDQQRVLRKGGRLSTEVWLRVHPQTGELAFEDVNEDGEVRWRLDVRSINLVDKIDDHGNVVIGKNGKPERTPEEEADAFVGIPFAWLTEDPAKHVDPITGAADRWVPTGISDPVVWMAAVLRAWERGRSGVPVSAGSLAGWTGLSEGYIRDLLAQAEDAGLLTVHGKRTGHRAALRRSHGLPVPESDRTTSGRCRGLLFQPDPHAQEGPRDPHGHEALLAVPTEPQPVHET